MAFKVSVAHGRVRLAAEFPTEVQALGEARNQIELEATDIRIEILATGEEFTFDEFRFNMAASARSATRKPASCTGVASPSRQTSMRTRR